MLAATINEPIIAATMASSFGDAVASGGLKIASAGTAQALFSAGLVKNIFANMPVPFTVYSEVWRKGHEYMAVDEADKLVEKTSKKLFERGVKAALPVAKPVKPAPEGPPPSGSGFIDDVPIEQLGLLYFAIVNMENGIGRGW